MQVLIAVPKNWVLDRDISGGLKNNRQRMIAATQYQGRGNRLRLAIFRQPWKAAGVLPPPHKYPRGVARSDQPAPFPQSKKVGGGASGAGGRTCAVFVGVAMMRCGSECITLNSFIINQIKLAHDPAMRHYLLSFAKESSALSVE